MDAKSETEGWNRSGGNTELVVTVRLSSQWRLPHSYSQSSGEPLYCCAFSLTSRRRAPLLCPDEIYAADDKEGKRSC